MFKPFINTVVILGISGSLFNSASSQGIWQSKTGMSVSGLSYPSGFSILSKGYVVNRNVVGGGNFWEWDQATDTWAQRADCPWIGGVGGAIAFSVGTKGYVGLGNNGGNYYNDMWEYDQGTNTWAAKNNFAGANRTQAVGFSIGSFGYVCLGEISLNTPYYTNDLWEYNPTGDTWTQRASFPGTPRNQAVAFTSGGFGFVGLGNDVSGVPQDFYKYNPSSNQWVPIQTFPASGRINAVAFGLGNYGYVGLGSYGPPFNTLYEYNTVSDQWITAATLPDSARSRSAYFCINNRGYAAAGLTTVGFTNDLWEFIPGWMTNTSHLSQTSEVICEQCDNFFVVKSHIEIFSIDVYNSTGKKICSSRSGTIPKSELNAGVYIIIVQLIGGRTIPIKVVKL